MSLSYGTSECDAVYGVQVLEYLPDLDQALRELCRVLRTGGRVLVLTTNWSSVFWNSDRPERMNQVLEGWEQHALFDDLERKGAYFFCSAVILTEALNVA